MTGEREREKKYTMSLVVIRGWKVLCRTLTPTGHRLHTCSNCCGSVCWLVSIAHYFCWAGILHSTAILAIGASKLNWLSPDGLFASSHVVLFRRLVYRVKAVIRYAGLLRTADKNGPAM